MTMLISSSGSTSIGEARSSAGQLTTLIQQVLESNLEISQRMANLEMRTLGHLESAGRTLVALEINRDDASINTMKVAEDANKDGNAPAQHVETIEETNQDADKESSSDQGPTFSFTFDEDLNRSRPYARAMKRNSVWSTASSAVHTMGWSYLSGLSLAEVSEISVIGLPISPQELWNGDHYVLTDLNIDSIHNRTQVPIMDDLANVQDTGLSKTESESLESRKEIFLYKSTHSVGGRSGLGPGDRQCRKVPVLTGGGLLELKKIILLSTNGRNFK